jgi:hypothetical protein
MEEVIRVTRSYRGSVFNSVSGVRPLRQDRYSRQGDSVSIACAPDPNVVIAVYVTASQPLTLRVARNNDLGLKLHVRDGVLIRDGVASKIRPEGLPHLALLSASPFTPLPPAAAGADRLLDATVSTGELRSHIVQYSEPSLAIPAVRGPGVIRVEISESGEVTSVSGPSAGMLDATALETIRAWKFRPFASGKAIGTVGFHIDHAGRVHTSLDPSARVY